MNYCPYCAYPIDHFSEAGEAFLCYSCGEAFTILHPADLEALEKIKADADQAGLLNENGLQDVMQRLGFLEEFGDDLQDVVAAYAALEDLDDEWTVHIAKNLLMDLKGLNL